MKGQFTLEIKKNFSPVQRVQSFANDYLSYYIHKNNHFLKRIGDTKPIDQIKKEKNKNLTSKLLKQYANIEKELELARKKKLEKVRNFYKQRATS